MNRAHLIAEIKRKKTCLCIGLDTDIEKIPTHLLSLPDPIFEFNKAIIDATKPFCISYKINTAFYEANGSKGWDTMQKTVAYIGNSHFIIADAKRGDIGNTSHQYAKAFFKTLPFDAVTISPYMGHDSVTPFLQYENKWAIVLGLTSNAGAADFELQKTNSNNYLYEKVLTTVAKWGSIDNTMFVIGATQAEEFKNIRNILPHHFFLIPGVGAQGGSIKDIAALAMNSDCSVLINISRAIIYADSTIHFAEVALQEAKKFQEEVAVYL